MGDGISFLIWPAPRGLAVLSVSFTPVSAFRSSFGACVHWLSGVKRIKLCSVFFPRLFSSRAAMVSEWHFMMIITTTRCLYLIVVLQYNAIVCSVLC